MTTLPALFQAAATQYPDAIAVVAGEDALTYAELDARASRLAHRLRRLGVGPDVPVAVLLERSLELPVALLGILKAGGACLPLEPAWPRERLELILADASPAAVLTSMALAGRLPPFAGPVIPTNAAGAEGVASDASADPDDLAYIIYTSGSTGRPKGVMLTHRGLVNHHLAVVGLYDLGPGDRVLQFCSIAFDASIEELFPSWAAGATVVFRPEDVPLLGTAWLAWLRRAAVTVVNLPTGYWHAWLRDLEALGEPPPEDIRLVVVGGEKASGPALRRWRAVGGARARWINVYGPAETTCMSTLWEAPAEPDDRDPPIGHPLPNTVVQVVDDRLQPVPDGTTGELLIGGAGLARGYLNQPGLTAERFVVHDGARLYRTGDLVRRRSDGELEFVGRTDDQVKVRGFRVECAEVEAALARHPAVAQAVVVGRDHPSGEKQLVAYVVAASGNLPGASELRRFLADRLPAYMVPTAFVDLDAVPLTPTGKVDRARLRTTGAAAPPRHATPPAGSATEEKIAAIWAAVLGIDVAAIGVEDDFFDLGGHSLLATQVIARVREEFATETPLCAIFEAPTVAGLASLVESESRRARPAPPLTPGRRRPGEKVPLSLAQEQMWALETAATPAGLYNLTALHRLARPVDEDALGNALASLVARHDILRTGFCADAAGPSQWVVPQADVELGVTDLAAVPEPGRPAELRRRIAEEDARPFDLSRPPLVRAHLFHTGDPQGTLALTFDHLVADGTAATIAMAELVTTYEGPAADRIAQLPPVELQYADFAAWQRSHVTEPVLARQLEWWTQVLAGMPLGPAVPFDHQPSALTRRIASTRFTVGSRTRRGLEQLAQATRSTVFIVTVAASQVVLGAAGGTTDVVASTTSSGRNRAELERMIGTFSGIGRLRVDLAGDPQFTEVVGRAREFVLGMFENQDIPFLRVRRALLPNFPREGLALANALPVELQYFRTRPEDRDVELFFRGQLHPLSITLLDDGNELSGEVSYKLDFYDAETITELVGGLERVFEAVSARPSARLSQLPVPPPRTARPRSGTRRPRSPAG